jgi:hypothetical protein
MGSSKERKEFKSPAVLLMLSFKRKIETISPLVPSFLLKKARA